MSRPVVLIGACLGPGVAVSLAGAAYQFGATRAERGRFPPPGRLIDVGGTRLHLDCRGQGHPVVLMDAGAGM